MAKMTIVYIRDRLGRIVRSFHSRDAEHLSDGRVRMTDYQGRRLLVDTDKNKITIFDNDEDT